MQEIRSREEIEATAARNFQQMALIVPWIKTGEAITRVMDENSSPRSKLGKLRRLQQALGDAAATVSPCKDGCSYCCHIPVLVTAGEAEEIALATGRKPASVPMRDMDALAALSETLEGRPYSPCPFLADGRCTVYEHRPSACRTHYTLDESAAYCDTAIPSDESIVPKANDFLLNVAFTLVVLKLKMTMGDVREFFPEDG